MNARDTGNKQASADWPASGSQPPCFDEGTTDAPSAVTSALLCLKARLFTILPQQSLHITSLFGFGLPLLEDFMQLLHIVLPQ